MVFIRHRVSVKRTEFGFYVVNFKAARIVWRNRQGDLADGHGRLRQLSVMIDNNLAGSGGQ